MTHSAKISAPLCLSVAYFKYCSALWETLTHGYKQMIGKKSRELFLNTVVECKYFIPSLAIAETKPSETEKKTLKLSRGSP